MKITKGQIVWVTTGEYSDYGVRDHMRALRDFDNTEEIARFKEEGDYLAVPARGISKKPTIDGADDRYLAWCIREGIMAPMGADEAVELHIGSYGGLGDYE